MSDKLRFIFSGIWQYLAPIIVLLLTNAGREALKAAGKYVEMVQEKYGTPPSDESKYDYNSMKHKEAFMLILEDLLKKGIYVGTGVINIAIIAAVEALKNK